MKLILIIICQFFTIVSSAQKILEEKYISDLKGAVKECNEFSFKTIGGFDSLENENIIKLFDKNGRLIEIRSDINEKTGKYEKTVLTYSESGCLQEIKQFYQNDSSKAHSVFECDKNGNIIKQTDYHYYWNGKAPAQFKQFTYDKNNRLTESFFRWGDRKVNNTARPGKEFVKEKTEHSVYTYDDNGFAIGRKIKRTGLEDWDWPALNGGTFEYKNDATGKRLFTYRINDDNSKKLIEEFKYNEKGFLQEHEQAGIRYVCEYEYDQHGNWTKKIDHVTTTTTTTIRKITYY